MENFKVSIFLLVLGIINFSCQSDGLSDSMQPQARDVKTYGDLEFIYRVTDMEGNPQSTFSEGENFMLEFVVTNHNENQVILCECDIPLEIADFFKIYQIENGQRIDIGKPYRGIGAALDLPITGIRGKSKIIYKIPWLPDNGRYPAPEGNISATTDYFGSEDNKPLNIGKYHSAFTLEYQNNLINFEIKFSIQ